MGTATPLIKLPPVKTTVVAEMITELIGFEPEIYICNGN